MNSIISNTTIRFREICIIFFFLLMATVSSGQAPNAINYQAVVRDGNGSIHQNKSVDFKFGIYSGSAASNKVYEETHSTTTNDLGLVNLQIGNGMVNSGSFNTIDWGSNQHHLKVELNTGSGYVDLGTMQLVSVPYALSAKKVSDMSLSELTDFSGITPSQGQVISFDGTAWVFDSLNPQKLYYSGSDISIQNDTIINTKPDEVVTLSGAGATSVSGVYPNFIINSNDSVRQIHSGKGISMNGDTIHTKMDDPLWNANKLQGMKVSSQSAYGGSVLTWNGDSSHWEPGYVVDNDLWWLDTASGGIVSTVSAVGIGASPQYALDVDNGIIMQRHGNSRNVQIGGGYNTGMLNLYDSTDSLNVEIRADDNVGGGRIKLWGASFGSENVILGSNTFNSDNGLVAIMNETSTRVATLEVLNDGAGIINTLGPNGTSNSRLSNLVAYPNHGSVAVTDSNGSDKAWMMASPTGGGQLVTLGNLNSSNVFLSSLATNLDHGYISVNDVSSAIQAGIYVDASGNGVVFGDQKNFRMPHPNQEDKEIWYGSLEGPELAAYMRGTATLVNGEVIVSFPEHYQIVANTSSMTVIITPLDAASKGLAVIEKGESGFTVKELSQGQGNYSFDWEVKCIRAGHEEYKVIRDALECQPSKTRGKTSSLQTTDANHSTE